LSALLVRDATRADAAAIAAIYNPYVTESIVTFEEDPVPASEIARRIEDVLSDGFPWLVAEQDRAVVGYAYATQWKGRRGYRHSTEITVYLDQACGGRGIGSELYRELFARLERKGVHVVIGGIALPNDASVALHEKFGLRKVAHFSEVGTKFGRWIDVGYWQRTFPR
jgi:phosphinothricin acetyltransferase